MRIQPEICIQLLPSKKVMQEPCISALTTAYMEVFQESDFQEKTSSERVKNRIKHDMSPVALPGVERTVALARAGEELIGFGWALYGFANWRDYADEVSHSIRWALPREEADKAEEIVWERLSTMREGVRNRAYFSEVGVKPEFRGGLGLALMLAVAEAVPETMGDYTIWTKEKTDMDRIMRGLMGGRALSENIPGERVLLYGLASDAKRGLRRMVGGRHGYPVQAVG